MISRALAPTKRRFFVADEPEILHRGLARFNARRLAPRGPSRAWGHDLQEEVRCRTLEHAFVERERAAVRSLLPPSPISPSSFLAWFRELEASGPGQGDPLFPWLEERASMAEMRWFLTQEAAGEAGFDDLVALTQVKLAERPKLELARNYWDEMGRGKAAGMHGKMLDDLVRHLGLEVAIHSTVWQSLALGNLLVALATDRHYAYQSIGALGAVELTAPSRVARVAHGLERLGISKADRMYFDLHATLDIKHADAWLAEVLLPLAADQPQCMEWIAEGALMRLTAGARCFSRYREALFTAGSIGR